MCILIFPLKIWAKSVHYTWQNTVNLNCQSWQHSIEISRQRVERSLMAPLLGETSGKRKRSWRDFFSTWSPRVTSSQSTQCLLKCRFPAHATYGTNIPSGSSPQHTDPVFLCFYTIFIIIHTSATTNPCIKYC